MCGMNSVKIKKIKVKKYNCDSVNGNLEKMAIGNRVIRYVFRGKFNSYNSHFLFFIKIFSSYSCDSPDKNKIKHDGSNYHISFTIGTNLELSIIIHKNNVIIISETARSILKKKKFKTTTIYIRNDTKEIGNFLPLTFNFEGRGIGSRTST